MEIKMELTLDDINIISAALNNDALVYLEEAKDEIEEKEFFDVSIESYRERILLKKKFDKLFIENMQGTGVKR